MLTKPTCFYLHGIVGNFGKCPALVEGTFGICVNNCESDGDCEDLSMKCCSNGCGQTCRAGKIMSMRLLVTFDFNTWLNEYLSVPCFVVLACTPVLCRLGCRWGFAKNTEGCEICQCSPPPGKFHNYSGPGTELYMSCAHSNNLVIR